VKAELDAAGLHAALKTSGVSGLHVMIPLPPRTRFDSAALVAQRLAERVVARHPRLATVARPLRSRPKGTIYLDARQNAVGKSVVVAYSLRERPGAPVSMPLDWRELRTTLSIGSFTLASASKRARRSSHLWSRAMARANSKQTIERLVRSD
jgi:bifunctional non-homologous end joining protein LigD